MRFGILALSALCLATPAAALAQDYRPVRCQARGDYEGAALRAPVTVPSIPALEAATLSPSAVSALDMAFAQMKAAAGAQALTMAVALDGEGVWSRTDAPAGASRLWWASAGKAFVATVVMQLVEENKLSLNDPLSRWAPQAPNAEAITVRDLLAHTSGLFSANEDARVRQRPHYLDTEETLSILRRHGAMFCPGANWRYSNSGYDLLGVIVEAVDGRSLSAAITARIIQPLNLTSAVVIAPGVENPGVAPSFSAREAALQPQIAGAGGPIAADARDMVVFWNALLSGRVLKPQSVQMMFGDLYPMFDPGTWYGLGTMAFDVKDGGREDLWLGHAGGAPGASAIILYSPADKAFVAVALTGDGPSTAVANGVLKVLRGVGGE